jgi:hypothetical protein
LRLYSYSNLCISSNLALPWACAYSHSACMWRARLAHYSSSTAHNTLIATNTSLIAGWLTKQDTRTDKWHCGGCGQRCDKPGQTCKNGKCKCPKGQTMCNGWCKVCERFVHKITGWYTWLATPKSAASCSTSQWVRGCQLHRCQPPQ